MAGSAHSPGIIHILVLVLVAGLISIRTHALAVHRRPPNRTSPPKPSEKTTPSSHSINHNHKLEGFLEDNVKLRKRLLDRVHSVLNEDMVKGIPSKRFNQYYRDFFPIRRSYIQPTRRGISRGPVIDHFAGVKTLSVPYQVDVESSTVQSVPSMENDGPEMPVTKPTPLDKTSTLKQEEKEHIFDQEYQLAGNLIGEVAPRNDLLKQGFESPRSMDGFILPHQSFSNPPTTLGSIPLPGTFMDRFTSPVYEPNDKTKANSRSRKYDHFGKYVPINDFDESGFDSFQFSQEDFGKHVPVSTYTGDSSSMLGFASDEGRFGFAKHRDLSNIGFSENAIQDSDAFRRLAVLGMVEDQKDCHNIDTKTCSKDNECMCMNLYKCVTGVCKNKISLFATTGSQKDNSNNGQWMTEPAREDKLGITN